MTTIVIALTILWEAAGCGPEEMRRVASVIHARKWDERERYGYDWRGVCLKPGAFRCWLNREKDPNNIQRYADQEAENDASLWFQCVQLAMELQDVDDDNNSTFQPTVIATHFWKVGTPVCASMAELPEVYRSAWHTWRLED